MFVKIRVYLYGCTCPGSETMLAGAPVSDMLAIWSLKVTMYYVGYLEPELNSCI